jgi:hypothetical protein
MSGRVVDFALLSMLQKRTKQDSVRRFAKSFTSETKLENGNGNMCGRGNKIGIEIEKSMP